MAARTCLHGPTGRAEARLDDGGVGNAMSAPDKQGLYDPRNEHDACGVGFVANIKGRKSHEVVACGLEILINLDHRGAVGADPLVGDGAGILIQIPDALLREWAKATEKVDPAAGRCHYAVAMCFLPQRSQGARARGTCKQFEHFMQGRRTALHAGLARRADRHRRAWARPCSTEMPLIRQAIIAMGPHTKESGCIWSASCSTIRKQTAEPAGRSGEEAQAAGHHSSCTCPASPPGRWSIRACCWRMTWAASTSRSAPIP